MEEYRSHRRVERISLPLPLRIEAKESRNVSWDEITHFSAISQCGAGFELKHKVNVGQLLLLSAPLPQKLRCYDHSEHQYRVWAIVRYCFVNDLKPDFFNIGVAFVGKYAPLSFHENPTKLYQLKNSNKQGFFEVCEAQEESLPTNEFIRTEDFFQTAPPRIERKYPRYSIPLEVILESFDQNTGKTISEVTVSENVSIYGTAVFTSSNPRIGDLVKLKFTSFNVSILAKVRNLRIGADGIPRLHLEFIDGQLPLEGIE